MQCFGLGIKTLLDFFWPDRQLACRASLLLLTTLFATISSAAHWPSIVCPFVYIIIEHHSRMISVHACQLGSRTIQQVVAEVGGQLGQLLRNGVEPLLLRPLLDNESRI